MHAADINGHTRFLRDGTHNFADKPLSASKTNIALQLHNPDATRNPIGPDNRLRHRRHLHQMQIHVLRNPLKQCDTTNAVAVGVETR